MSKLRRVVFYAVNGSGMGHLTRLLAVARWVRRYLAVLEERPPEIIFLTSSEATGALLEAGFASFKLPSKTVVRHAGMDMLEYRRLAKHFVWQMLGVFSPDLLVVDTFPAGSFDELFQILDGPFRKAFILRRVKPEYAARPIYRAALGLYPSVVVPHTPEVFGGALPPGVTSARVSYAGEVLQYEPAELLPAGEARARLGVPTDARLVYISAGGGGDPHTEQALSALVAALADLPDVWLLVGAGPLYNGRRLSGPRLVWFTGAQVHFYFGGCDAAISAGGYNTFHELLLARVPSVFFAQEKVADDQGERIRRAAEIGACYMLEDVSDAEATRALLARALEPVNRAPLVAAMEAALPDNGAARAARALLEGIYGQAALGWASGVVTAEIARAFEALGSEGSVLMSRWLPQLVPQARWGMLHAQPSFQALLGQLAPDMAAAVAAAAAQTPEASALRRVQEALGALLSRAEATPGGVEALMGLVDSAMRKHPLAQEASEDWASWIGAVLERLLALFDREPPAGWSAADVAQLYRVFPRVADVDAAGAFVLLDEVLAGIGARGVTFEGAQAQLRGLKFGDRRVTATALRAWAEGLR